MEILEHSGPTRGLRHWHLELPEVASLEPPQRVPLHVDVVDAKVGRVNRVPVVASSEDRVVGIVLSVIAKIDVFIGGVILVAAVVEVTQERWRLTVHLKTEQMLVRNILSANSSREARISYLDFQLYKFGKSKLFTIN